MKDLIWYKSDKTPKIAPENLVSEHFVSRAKTDLIYIRSSVSTEDVINERNLTFEFGIEKVISDPV